MSRPFFYCSELSRDAAEQSFGTASIGEVWLLIEYREAWGAHALEDSALPARVKTHLNKFCKTVPRSRILFIKQERMRPEVPFSCFVVRCRERAQSIVKFQLSDYEELLKFDAEALAGESLAGKVQLDEPLFLVCTHGTRDKCCAKFGYALYKTLRGQTAGDARIWQSSHVGGDRFAANLICFPHGLFYAHVTEDAGRKIVAEYDGRRLVLEGYRGRASYPYPVQAAEFFIRTKTGLNALDGLRYLQHERTGERSWFIKFVDEGARTIHEAHVAAQPSGFHNYITCNSAAEQRVVQYELKEYRATGEPKGV